MALKGFLAYMWDTRGEDCGRGPQPSGETAPALRPAAGGGVPRRTVRCAAGRAGAGPGADREPRAGRGLAREGPSMKREVVRIPVCPECKADLTPGVERSEGNEIMQGSLSCVACPATYPIRDGVPRFVADDSYASSFGRQWNWFRTVQLDSLNGTKESENTLGDTTGWQDADYQGRLVLDAGAGAGRFAEIVANKGGEVVGVDLSRAIDAAFVNIGRREQIGRAHV